MPFTRKEGTSNNNTYTPQFDSWPNPCSTNLHKAMQMADVAVCSMDSEIMVLTKLVLTGGFELFL